MTARSTALIAAAKAKAIPVTSCVAASLRPDHLLSGCTWEELAALVIVLAEAVDPARLRVVVSAVDDGGAAAGVLSPERLKKAHAEAQQYRRAGLDVPPYLDRLDTEYRRDQKRRQKREREAA